MKSSILHTGKLFQFERQNSYQRHKQKINQIIRKKSSKFPSKNEPFLPTHLSSYKIEQKYKVDTQNDRLVKKLFEINRRKKFYILNSDEEYRNQAKLTEFHKKYNQLQRIRKENQIKEANQKLVEKLLEKRQKIRNNDEFIRDDNDPFLLKMSRSRKKLQKKVNKNKQKSQKNTKKSTHLLSLLEQYTESDIQDKTPQRSQNYSNLLPHISKNSYQNDRKLINHTELIHLLKKYDNYKEKQQLLQHQAKISNTQNVSRLIQTKKSKNVLNDANLKQYQGDFEKEQEKYQEQLKHLHKQIIISQGYVVERQAFQLATKANPMDPTIKFEKIKKRVNKKFQENRKIELANQFADQQLEVDIYQ